ncbi:MAG TPA: hypothetical protein VF616_32630 [Duganella sp.]|uniref:hypothetical protein n=1 Tax=Duganella sp. TaxID=1904440 RepID=UPI002ED04D94
MPKKIFAALCGIMLLGCAAQPILIADKNNGIDNFSMPDGAWQGTLHWRGTKADDSHFRTDGRPFEGDIIVMVTSCKSEKKFWIKGDDGIFHAKIVKYENNSYFGNHLIYYQNHSDGIENPPEWVETQSILLMEIDQKTLRAQWSRSVSNPQLPPGDKERDFFLSGIGTLERISDLCPADKLPNMQYHGS